MDFYAFDDDATQARRRRIVRRHDKHQGDASFAGVRGVEEALEHLFHPRQRLRRRIVTVVTEGDGHCDDATVPTRPRTYGSLLHMVKKVSVCSGGDWQRRW